MAVEARICWGQTASRVGWERQLLGMDMEEVGRLRLCRKARWTAGAARTEKPKRTPSAAR